jgi:hypothetical protein
MTWKTSAPVLICGPVCGKMGKREACMSFLDKTLWPAILLWYNLSEFAHVFKYLKIFQSLSTATHVLHTELAIWQWNTETSSTNRKDWNPSIKRWYTISCVSSLCSNVQHCQHSWSNGMCTQLNRLNTRTFLHNSCSTKLHFTILDFFCFLHSIPSTTPSSELTLTALLNLP